MPPKWALARPCTARAKSASQSLSPLAAIDSQCIMLASRAALCVAIPSHRRAFIAGAGAAASERAIELMEWPAVVTGGASGLANQRARPGPPRRESRGVRPRRGQGGGWSEIGGTFASRCDQREGAAALLRARAAHGRDRVWSIAPALPMPPRRRPRSRPAKSILKPLSSSSWLRINLVGASLHRHSARHGASTLPRDSERGQS